MKLLPGQFYKNLVVFHHRKISTLAELHPFHSGNISTNFQVFFYFLLGKKTNSDLTPSKNKTLPPSQSTNKPSQFSFVFIQGETPLATLYLVNTLK